MGTPVAMALNETAVGKNDENRNFDNEHMSK